MKPFGKAKVRQLREEAKKKEMSDLRNVAVVATQEDIPPKGRGKCQGGDEGFCSAGNQFGCAAHDEQKKKPA